MGPPRPSDVVFGARAEAVVSTVILVFLLYLEQRLFFCLHNHTWYTCTTVFFHRACTIAKKNYHRSLDLCARHSFFPVFLTVICCFFNQSVSPSDSGSLSPSSGTTACQLSRDHTTDICILPLMSHTSCSPPHSPLSLLNVCFKQAHP